MIEKRWLDISELSAYIGFSSKTIYNWVSELRIPGCSKINGRLRFDRKKIDHWLERKELEEAAEGAGRFI